MLSGDPDVVLDSANAFGGPLLRAYTRTLYGYDLSGDQATTPVPDLASGPPQVSDDGRTYTFRLRAGVRYAPPVDREVAAQHFIAAIERLYDRESPSAGQQFANLIAGAAAFGAGKARRISGLAAPDPRTLEITLDQPAGDLLWILALSFFAPVPEEHAAGYGVGEGYDGHVVGAGPYKLATHITVFLRNCRDATRALGDRELLSLGILIRNLALNCCSSVLKIVASRGFTGS